MSTQTNPVKAIREKCLDCCCGSYIEVTNCTVTKCALYPFRLGKNPYRQRRKISEEQKQQFIHRMQESRKINNSINEDLHNRGK